MATRQYTDAELEAAIEVLSERGRFDEAESVVASAAPQLQKLLAEVLQSGGWFDDSHQAEIEKTAAIEEPAERVLAVRTLLVEESRLAMMVGVAVGWALADQLASSDSGSN